MPYADPEKNKLCRKRYSEKQESKDRAMNRRLISRYSLNLQMYNALLKEQNFVCKICKKPEIKVCSKTKKLIKLSVDHDHKTGYVRGLLCYKCNTQLGNYENFGNDFKAYLETHNNEKLDLLNFIMNSVDVAAVNLRK